MGTIVSNKKLSATKYKELADNYTADLLQYASETGKLLYTSGSAKAITGYTNAELTKLPMTYLVFPSDLETFTSTFNEVLGTQGEELRCYYWAMHKNGSKMYFEATFKNLLHIPEVNAILITSRNVSHLFHAKIRVNTAEENLKAILDISTDVIWAIDVDKRLIVSNKQFIDKIKQISGIELQPGDYAILPELGIEMIKEWEGLYNRALQGEKFTIEKKHYLSKSEDYTVVSFNPFYEDGNVAGVACCAKEKIALQQKLSERENLLGSLVNSISNFLVRIGLNGHLSFVNHTYCEKMGVTEKELIGMPAINDVYEGDKRKMEEVVKQCIQNPGSYISTVIRKVKRNTKEIIHTEWEFIALQNNENNVTEIQGIGKDITDKIIVENELVLNMVKLENTLENMTDGFFALNHELLFIRVNKILEATLKINRNDILGKSLLELYPVLEKSDIYKAILQVLKRGTTSYLQEYFSRTDRWFEFNLYPTQEGVAIYFRDISERKQREREIKELNEELEKRVSERTKELTIANTELESFSYSVSHDLRAPLRSIDGFSEILLEDYYSTLDETGKQHLNRIRGAAQKMSQLIDDLLKLSRVTRQPITKREINLSEMALIICHEKSHFYQDGKFTINISEDIKIIADPSLLNIALENLLDNAFKFSSKAEKPLIVFGVKKDRDNKRVYYLSDNGVGFDMQYAERLFSPFRRLHSEREFHGTGIGLSIVKRVITRHNGKIWAESSLNEGTTIYFTLEN
jgi:PAS domain S-box-containing protein